MLKKNHASAQIPDNFLLVSNLSFKVNFESPLPFCRYFPFAFNYDFVSGIVSIQKLTNRFECLRNAFTFISGDCESVLADSKSQLINTFKNGDSLSKIFLGWLIYFLKLLPNANTNYDQAHIEYKIELFGYFSSSPFFYPTLIKAIFQYGPLFL